MAASLKASLAALASSTTKMLPPKPVAVPEIEVTSRSPAASLTKRCEVFSSESRRKRSPQRCWYQSDWISRRLREAEAQGELLGVGGVDELRAGPAGGAVALLGLRPHPGWEADGAERTLARPRRDVDDQPLDLAVDDRLQVLADRLDGPAVAERGRVDLLPGLAREGIKVFLQIEALEVLALLRQIDLQPAEVDDGAHRAASAIFSSRSRNAAGVASRMRVLSLPPTAATTPIRRALA